MKPHLSSPTLWRVRALSICVGGWNGELAPPWEGGQRQGRDHRRIWESGGRLSKAKGRRGSGERALQVREGRASGRTENMWVTPRGASRKKSEGWVRLSEVRDDAAGLQSMERRNMTSSGGLDLGSALSLLIQLVTSSWTAQRCSSCRKM